MKAYIMGNYTEKAFQGFLKDPGTDRKAVVEQLTKAMGGTMHSMDIVRGSYDFVVVVDLNERKVAEFEVEKVKIMDDFIDKNKSQFKNENLKFSSKLKKN